MKETSENNRQIFVLLISLVSSFIIGFIPTWTKVEFSTPDQILLSVASFIAFLLLDIMWLVANIAKKISKEHGLWTIQNQGDQELTNIKAYFEQIVRSSYGPRDVFLTHFSKRFHQLKNDIKDSAEKGVLRVRADHFLNVENVTDAFSGENERIWKHIWPIRKKEKLFDNLPWKRYFEVTTDMVKKKQIDCIRTILIFDEKGTIDDPRTKKLLDFFKTNIGLECRTMHENDYNSICGDNDIASHLDFGIYGKRLLFLTQQYEPEITGTFTKDNEVINKYIQLFDSMWCSQSVTRENTSMATTAITVNELFAFDDSEPL